MLAMIVVLCGDELGSGSSQIWLLIIKVTVFITVIELYC